MPLSAPEQRLCDTIAARHAALLEDLRTHVALSTGHNNTPALDDTRNLLCERLQKLGAAREDIPGDAKPEWLAEPAPRDSSLATRDSVPPTAICRRARQGLPRILIAGHLDTVHDPRGNFRELTISRDGATATGPGCVDMKGGLVIAVHALEALEEAGIPVSWSFLLNSDEETGSYHSDRAIRRAASQHDFGLALEPAMAKGELALTRGGSGQFMIETFGKAAHVGRDFASGVSAVSALARAIVAADGLVDIPRGRFVNVGPLEGGIATNVIADHARAWGNIRFPDADGAAALESGLNMLQAPSQRQRHAESIITPNAAAVPPTQVYRSFNRPAKPLTPATEKLALAARAAAEDLGQKLPFAHTGGVCDGNNMQAAGGGGLPTIDTLGVRGGGLHTPQEWIELASLVERCQLLAVLMTRLSS